MHGMIRQVFAKALERAHEAIFISDENTNFVYANNFAAEYLGYTVDELLGLKICDIDANFTDTTDVKNKWHEFITEQTDRLETIHVGKDGRLIPVEVSPVFVHHDGALFCVSFIRDIKTKITQEEELKLFHLLIDNSNDMIFVVRLDDKAVEFANKTAQNVLGYSLEEIQTIGVEGFRRPLKENEPFAKHLEELQQKGAMTDYAILIRKDGSEFPVEVSVKVIKHKNISYNIAIARDITERAEYERKLANTNKWLESAVVEHTRALQENILKLQSYKTALDANSIVSIANPKGVITYVNKKFEEVSGFTQEETLGKNHNIVRHPDTPKDTFAKMWETLKAKKVWLGQMKNRKKDGDSYYIDSAIVPILDANGDIVEYIACRHEITDLIKQKDELKMMAITDALTGLGNRTKLYDILNKSQNASLALIDINGFHIINDFYGASLGDSVIKQFALGLKELCNGKYEIFHLHGDEFILLNQTEENDKFTDDIKQINNLLSNKPIVIDEKVLPITTTASISFEPVTHLVESVNMAHSYAKKVKERFVIYSRSNSLEKEYEENIKWTTKIKSAIENDRIAVFYQPIVDTKTKQIAKYESLVRLIEEDGKVVSPFFFLERSKKSGQYLDITKIVVEKTLARMNLTNEKFSINLTIEDILNSSLKSFLIEKFSNCTKCHNITFEIVESEGIDNFEEVNNFIKVMKSFGCTFAIDDFGTGYSNFEYLLRLNTEYVKIDGSLIKQIETNQDYYDIVKTIVAFANIKKLIVIAEFVSNESIYEKITELGIGLAQGYYFSEPINFDDNYTRQ